MLNYFYFYQSISNGDIGVKVVGVTGFAKSPLAKKCDIVLLSRSFETEEYREATTSRLTMLMLCDCLVESIVLRLGESAIISLDRMVDIYEQYREEARKDKRLN